MKDSGESVPPRRWWFESAQTTSGDPYLTIVSEATPAYEQRLFRSPPPPDPLTGIGVGSTRQWVEAIWEGRCWVAVPEKRKPQQRRVQRRQT